MNLRKITYILIVSLIASFLLRTTGTLFPHIFQYSSVVKVTIVINIIFILAHAFFYVYFLKEYAANRQQILKTGSILAIIGSFSVALIYIKNFCLVFGLDVLPLIFMDAYFDVIIPLVSSLFHLLFFSIFKKVQSQDEYRILSRPVSSAIIGVVIFIVLHLIVLVNFLKLHKFNWLEHMPRNIAIGTIPLFVFAAIFILYFYIKFYQFLFFYGKKSIKINSWHKSYSVDNWSQTTAVNQNPRCPVLRLWLQMKSSINFDNQKVLILASKILEHEKL